MKSKSRFAVYFDWSTGLRVGGPPGYLANLQSGLDAIGRRDAVDFILRDAAAQTSASNESRAIISKGPVFSKGATPAPIGKTSNRSDEALKLAAFHTRPDYFYVPPADMSRIDPQARSILHVHTTVDAVKAHNSLTRLGQRHNVVLVLTTHSPEIPAKEWAEKAFHDGASLDAAELLYYNHRETDLFAFHVADALVFPCEEAIDPYIGTIPRFKNLFSQKDFYFILTGAKALTVKNQREAMRDQLGIPQDNFVACYIGRHNSVKGYDILCKVGEDYIKRHENATFLVGGRPGPIPSPKHHRWVEAGWTEFPGDLINCSDVFILPNKQTYFDLMLIEVLSTGKIAIISNTGGNKYFKNRSPGIITYKTESELFEALDFVRSLNREQISNLEAENKKLYDRELSHEIFAKNYLKLLGQIEVNKFGKNNNSYKTLDHERSSSRAPLVSVIVAVYNVESYLSRCLQSIAEQNFQNLEVIVVNDGSTDGSSNIIDEFTASDRRFRRVDRPNGGLSAARNTGLDICLGEYVSFVDGDDLLAPDMIGSLLKAIEDTNTKVAVCGVQIVDDSEKHIANVTSFLFDEAVYPKWRNEKITVTPDVITSIFPSAWNKIYHRSLFDKIRYPVGLYYEDHPVFYKIFINLAEFAYVNKPLYIHRERSSGRITQDGSRRFIDIFVVIDLIESILREKFDMITIRRLVVKLTMRLSWERSWVVGNPVLRYKLAEQTLMRLYRWGMSSDERRLIQDSLIERDYVEKLESIINSHKNLDSPAKAVWPLEQTISVDDCTIYKSIPGFNAIELNSAQGYILVHPIRDALSTAAVHGLSHFGPVKVSFTVALEHESSEDVEFRTFILPFMAPDKSDLIGEIGLSNLFSLDWTRLTPFSEVEVSATIPESTPTMTIYLQTRSLEGGSVNFSWVRFRRFCCVDVSA